MEVVFEVVCRLLELDSDDLDDDELREVEVDELREVLKLVIWLDEVGFDVVAREVETVEDEEVREDNVDDLDVVEKAEDEELREDDADDFDVVETVELVEDFDVLELTVEDFEGSVELLVETVVEDGDFVEDEEP